MRMAIKELMYQLRYGLPVWFIGVVTFFLPDIGPFIRMRGWLVAIFLPGRPTGFKLGRDVTLLSLNRLVIGRHVYIAKGTWINAVGGLSIGDEVLIGPYVVISTAKHGYKDGSPRFGGAHPNPIAIGSRCWIASHSNIVAGVRIGSGCIVGSNSVVTKDTCDDVVVGGVPAKVIGKRLDNPSSVVNKHDAE